MAIEINSIGRLCTRFQAGIPAVQRALQRAGIEPHIYINDTAHYAEHDVARIAEQFRSGQATSRPKSTRQKVPS